MSARQGRQGDDWFSEGSVTDAQSPLSHLVSPQSPTPSGPPPMIIPHDENLPEVLTADNAGLWQNEKCVDDTNRMDDKAKYLVPVHYPEVAESPPPPGYDKPLPPLQDNGKRVFTVKRKTLWIVIGVVLAIAAIVGGVVGGVVGTKHAKDSSHESAADLNGASTSALSSAATFLSTELSSTLTPTTTLFVSTRKSTSSASSATATSTGVCIAGTVADGETQNYLGLCKFCCSNGYCPPGPCTCTDHGTEDDLNIPAETNTTGCPLKGESDGYLGLCSFACNHGYCPDTACTTDGCDSS